MGLGGVAALAGVQVEHHGVVGVGDGGGVAPGVLGVKQKVVLGGAAEGRALLPQLGLQSAGQPVAALGLPVVLHRVGGGAHAVCPPIGQIPAVHRAVRQGSRMALYSSWRDTIRSCTP